MADVRLAVDKGSVGKVQLNGSYTLQGSHVRTTVHIIRGKFDGPTLTIMGVVHGDETGTLPMFKRFMESLNPEHMSGTILVVPVANPMALASFSRISPEQHGNTDLHAVFPGNLGGSLTQHLAHLLTEEVLKGTDFLVDIHSGGAGGRLQKRVDFDERLTGTIRERTLGLCKAFGFNLVHANHLQGTASYWLNQRDVPTVNVEIGGAYLGPTADSAFINDGVRGLSSVTKHIGITDDAIDTTPQQCLLFDRAARLEINPRSAGYIESRFDHVEQLTQLVEQGTVLGTVMDPYSLEAIEELTAPCNGYLFFSRYSGVVESGSKAFGLAMEDSTVWV